MPRYVAFLRAINVGGRTIKMAALRSHFKSLGFADVSTFIASGNVVFQSPDEEVSGLEARIEEGLRGLIGYTSEAFVRSEEELAAMAGHVPFPSPDRDIAGSSLYVMFLQRGLSEDARDSVLSLRSDADDFRVDGREIYWWSRSTMSQSPLFSGAALAKAIGMPTTTRNITTIRKLGAKLFDKKR